MCQTFNGGYMWDGNGIGGRLLKRTFALTLHITELFEVGLFYNENVLIV